MFEAHETPATSHGGFMHAAKEDTAGGHAPWPGSGWALLLILAAVQFTHVVDFIIMMPLGPRYLRELDIGPPEFSLLVSAYAFSACLSGLLAASLIDRFDRKRSLLVLFAGFTLGTALCAVPGFGVLLVGRAVAGTFGGVLAAVSLAIIGDVFPEERRGLATGVVMSSFSAATIVGIPAGLFLANAFGTWAPFGFLAALSGSVLLLALRVLPPLRHHLDGEHAHVERNWKVLYQPAHLRAYVLATCLVLATFTIIPSLPTFLVKNLNWEESDLAVMYLCGGLATLVTTSLFGRLADRLGKLPVFRILALLTMVPVLVITNLTETSLTTGLVITTIFMILASGRMVPAMALITSSAKPAYRGSFMSVIASVQQMAVGLGAVIAGLVVTQPVKEGPLEHYPIVGLVACSMALAAVLLAGYVRPAVEPEPTPAEESASADSLPDPVELSL
jgi:predicted MFS family arabinose efflux permease